MPRALPYGRFADVQRYLRQRRAGGQTVTPREARLAWQAYWDVEGARSLQNRQLDLQRRALAQQQYNEQQRIDLAKTQMEREQEAAKIAGITELGGTAALGAIALKGTSIGEKIGLGAPSVTAPAIPQAPTGLAATATTAAPQIASAAAQTPSLTAALSGSAPQATTGLSATSAPVGAGAGSVAALGLGGGLAGAQLGKLTTGKDIGAVGGGVAGGALGGAYAGAQVGTIGGPYGALFGGIVGGAIGLIQTKK